MPWRRCLCSLPRVRPRRASRCRRTPIASLLYSDDTNESRPLSDPHQTLWSPRSGNRCHYPVYLSLATSRGSCAILLHSETRLAPFHRKGTQHLAVTRGPYYAALEAAVGPEGLASGWYISALSCKLWLCEGH